MIKNILRSAVIALSIPMLVAMPASASTLYYHDFASQPGDLYFVNYEGGVDTPNLVCGVDACASFESANGTDFMRVAVNPSQTPGFYTNTDVTQLDLSQEGAEGEYTPSNGHPVTVEARIKWSSNYDLLGLGEAQGTSGLVLWNPALDGPNGMPTAEYDQIGFVWASADVLAGVITGFTGSSFVNQVPLGVSRPVPVLQLNTLSEWMNVKMVWSENLLGIQTVKYYVNDQLFGVHVLPVALENMGLEIWNDNQEPYLCPEGLGGGLPLCFNYPNPSQSQSFYVDYVHISQT